MRWFAWGVAAIVLAAAATVGIAGNKVSSHGNAAAAQYGTGPPPPQNQPAPAGQTAAAQGGHRPRIRIAGARARCAHVRTRLRVRISASGLRSVTVKLGHKVIRRTHSGSFSLTLRRAKLHYGRNLVRIIATDAQGRRTTRRARLTRCRTHVSPRFTG